MAQKAKVDKRTTYTKNVIKDAILELMEKKPFDKITITEVCKQAEINRGTYYLHYYELTEVLDELIEDAFSDTEVHSGNLDMADRYAESSCPNFSLCQIIRHSTKYRALFFDDSLTTRIIGRIEKLHKAEFVADTTARYNISQEQAEAIFLFQTNGCFAISKIGRHFDCNNWIKIREVMDSFIMGGLNQLPK